MNVTITGASGFVGINLSKHLKSIGHRVSELSLRVPDWTLDADAEVIVHLAGKAHDTKNNADEAEYFSINTDLTKKIFDRFLVSESKVFIYFSSVKAVADSPVGTITEQYPPTPQTAYGKSKLQAEAYLLSKQLPSDKKLIIVRPCMIHGEGNKGNLSLLYKVVKYGIPWPLGKFDNLRSFLGIDNLCFLISAMIQKDQFKSGVYNLSDDDALSTNEITQLINQVKNKQAKILNVPKSLIFFMAKLGDILPLPLNTEKLQKLTENYLVSNDKIKKELGIASLPTSVSQGMLRTLASFEQV